jgi:hypothetical protein
MIEPWIDLKRATVSLIGATACQLHEYIHIIGGCSAGDKLSNYIQVSVMDPKTATIIPSIINTGGTIMNRSHHAAVTIEDSCYLFGGKLDDQSITNEIIRCHISDEGFVCSLFRNDGIARYGLGAALVGPQLKTVILFGGTDNINYFNDVLVLKDPITSSNPLERPSVEGDKPSARSYFTYDVCGDQNQYIIVTGGYDGTKLLRDVWILDVSRCIPELKNEIDVTTKGGKGGGGKGNTIAIEESIKWTKLTIELPYATSQHCSFLTKESNGEYLLYIFGGISIVGILPMNPSIFKINIMGNTISPVCANLITTGDESIQCSHRFGCASICIGENISSRSMALLFGGNISSSSTLGYILNRQDPFCQNILHVIQKQIEDDEIANRLINDEENNDRNGNRNLDREVLYTNGDRYIGELILNTENPTDLNMAIRSGKGTMYYSDGSQYEGMWYDNQRHGKGNYTYISEFSMTYIGEFTNDIMTGEGICTINSTGEELHGYFINGQLQGDGYWKNSNGFHYSGQFQNSLKHGIGTLYEMENNQKRIIYEGEWIHGIANGKGKLYLMIPTEDSGGLKIEAQYEGDIVNSMPHGKGTMIYSNGAHYSGDWRKGMRNGFGSYIDIYQNTYDGKWVTHKRCGRGIWKSKGGDIYNGIWESDLPHGEGIYQYADGKSYSGQWYHGKQYGSGILQNIDGSCYRGEWKDGRLDGFGELISASGAIQYAGIFLDGEAVGNSLKSSNSPISTHLS